MPEQEKEKFLTEFGNRVRQYRTEKKMSLDELARKCGYTSDNARSSIQKIEAGKSDVPASKIRLLAKALELPVNAIMGWPDEREAGCTANSSPLLRAALVEQYGLSAPEALTLYARLDASDQGEIRGEMKHMLRAGKYFAQEELLNAAHAIPDAPIEDVNFDESIMDSRDF